MSCRPSFSLGWGWRRKSQKMFAAAGEGNCEPIAIRTMKIMIGSYLSLFDFSTVGICRTTLIKKKSIVNIFLQKRSEHGHYLYLESGGRLRCFCQISTGLNLDRCTATVTATLQVQNLGSS